MSNRNNAPRIAFSLKDIESEDLRDKLGMNYIMLEQLKRIRVQAIRSVELAAAEAAKASAEVSIAETKLLIDAGEAFDLITTEPAWQVRRNGQGDVIFECLLTETDVQNLQRAHSQQIRSQAANAVSGDDSSSGMFRDED
jgi:hypothetical protein